MNEKDIYKTSRFLYIIEAALEYFITVAVGTVYLAKLAEYIGLSDSMTGILTSFVALGNGFQFLAVFLSNKRKVKRWVFCGHTVSQLFFSSIYFIAIAPISKGNKEFLFVAFLLIAQIIHNMISAPKINWYMSLVPYGQKGLFTANKEIVSLIGGMFFSYSFAYLIEYHEKKNEVSTAFLFCGICLLVLTVLHSLTLFFSKEKEEEGEKTELRSVFKSLLKEKNMYKVVLIAVFWSVASHVSIPFMGTYQAKELRFSTTFSSIIIIIGSFIRVLFSKPMGRMADKYSFIKMLKVCFFIAALGFFINSFCNPSNGGIMYTLYYILYCIGMAGINSAMINLIYGYVRLEHQMSALAIQYSFSGVIGFLSTLLAGILVSYIQKNGNSFLGLPIYAQQALSFFSFILVVLLLVYLHFFEKSKN